MVKAKDKGERLEEELQMTEKISPQEGYFSGSPHGDKFWNEPRKRTPEDQNRSQEGIIEYMRDNMQQEMMMNYLMEMFNQSPSDFEQQFGNEAAETMRMLQGFKTKGQMEEEGMIFEPGTTELRAHKASFSPDQVALGTLPTDQSGSYDDVMEFIKERQNTQSLKERQNTQSLLERTQIQDKLLQDQLTEEVTPYREGITEMNEDISGILKSLPKQMWYNLLDKIKPYYLNELDMMLLHKGVDFDGVLKEERLIERGSEDWNKLQKLKQDLQNQIDERWTRE